MTDPVILNEEAFVEGLGDMIKSGVKNAADRVKYGFAGDTEARGRLDLNAATKHLYKDWMAYVGRHASAGNATIKQSPTLADLAEFLHFQYGVEISDDQLSKIASAPAGQTAVPKSADDHAKETLSHLKATSPDEYNALRKKMRKESLEEASAAEITFDPKVLFPKLANILIQHGIISVSRRGGKTAGTVSSQQNGRADGGAAEPAPKTSPKKPKEEPQPAAAAAVKAANPDAEPEAVEPETAPAPDADTNGDGKVDKRDMVAGSITPDGHYIDAKKFMRGLEENGITTKKEMDELRREAGASDLAFLNHVRRSAERNGTLAADVGGVIASALGAISNTDSGQVKNSNVTPSGNTVNISSFKETLAAGDVSGEMLNKLREALKGSDINEILQSKSQVSKTAIVVFKAVINAIQKVAPAEKAG